MFQLKATKGTKKSAVLPWDDLRDALDQNPVILPQYHTLKGKLTHGGMDLLAGAKIVDIIRIARHIDPNRDYVTNWPRREGYEIPRELGQLSQHLNLILKIVKLKKSSRTGGFLSLQGDGNGLYWFKPHRNFYTAATESLASLEELIDGIGESTVNEVISAAYRRLAAIVEQ